MISIIDDNGSRQFSVHRLVQKIALFVGIAIAVCVILYLIMAHFLMSELEGILERNAQAREKFQTIYEKNSELERNIDYKTSELIKVSGKINELESIVNVQTRNTENRKNEDISLDSLSSLQKDMILKIIPNGNPVDDFSSKTYPNKSSLVYTLTKDLPVYATANGIIDSVRAASNEDQFVQIQHSYGFTSNYGHLTKVVVQKGDFVTKGQMIGYSAQKMGLYYDLRFLDSPLEIASYIDWNSENFAQVVGGNSSIDWKSLVWALDDIIQLKNYRVSFQGETQKNY